MRSCPPWAASPPDKRRSYAIVLHRGRWDDAGLYALADDVLLPLEHTWVTATTGTAPASGSALSVGGAEVTAVRREGPDLVVRMVRASGEGGRVEIDREGAPTGRAAIELGPWEIATVRPDVPGALDALLGR